MRPARPDYYQVLGVSRDATADDIRRAYRRLARRYHPDVNAGVDARARFGELSDAYEVLHDPEQRARYDHSSAGAELPIREARERAPSPRRRAPAPRDRAPAFTRGPSRRDVPRFLDDDAADAVPGAGGLAPQWLVVVSDSGERPVVRWWPW
jgi:curved DNA-binding protein CbpA